MSFGIIYPDYGQGKVGLLSNPPTALSITKSKSGRCPATAPNDHERQVEHFQASIASLTLKPRRDTLQVPDVAAVKG